MLGSLSSSDINFFENSDMCMPVWEWDLSEENLGLFWYQSMYLVSLNPATNRLLDALLQPLILL